MGSAFRQRSSCPIDYVEEINFSSSVPGCYIPDVPDPIFVPDIFTFPIPIPSTGVQGVCLPVVDSITIYQSSTAGFDVEINPDPSFGNAKPHFKFTVSFPGGGGSGCTCAVVSDDTDTQAQVNSVAGLITLAFDALPDINGNGINGQSFRPGINKSHVWAKIDGRVFDQQAWNTDPSLLGLMEWCISFDDNCFYLRIQALGADNDGPFRVGFYGEASSPGDVFPPGSSVAP